MSDSGVNYAFNKKGRDLLCKRLADRGFFTQESGEFDFINPPEGWNLPVWQYWEQNYFNYKTIPALAFWPDCLYAALASFVFRAVAQGTYRIIDKGFEIYQKKIGVYIRDIFNFEGSELLGWWSCILKDFSPIPLHWPYYEITNGTMEKFGNDYEVGENFLVLSDPHIVEFFKGKPYICGQ